MAEILFIAIDPVILTLVENLQQLVEPRISLESDYTSGIKRIFDTRPSVVFLQHKIGTMTCDKLANQVKILLDGEPVPLVLLSDEPVMSYSVVSTYEACFDLCLPFNELSMQVQRLLRTLPEIAWKNSAAAAARLPDGPPPDMMLELSLPDGGDAFSQPFPWQENPTAGTGPASPLDGRGTLAALEGNGVTPAERPEISAPKQEEPQFLADFLQDRFVIEALPPDFGAPEEHEKTPTGTGSIHNGPNNDFQFSENESQNDLFWNSPESLLKPSLPAPEAGGRQPAVSEPPRELPRSAPAAVKPERSASPVRQPTAAAGAARPAGSLTVDELFNPSPSGLARKRESGLLLRVLIACLLLVLTAGLLDLFVTRRPAKLDVTQEIHELNKTLQSPTLKTPSATSPRAAEQLPPFIPPVPADPAYAESHPGWERYLADAREYLVFRENGSIRAVQVLSEQRGSIPDTFLKTSLRISSGSDHFVAKKKEERSGIQITSGVLQNGGELLVYRTVTNGEIRGFVIAFPADSKGAKS